MIDSHCHLAGTDFHDDVEAVTARAVAAGVEQALVILEAGDAAEEAQASRVAACWPAVRFAVGVHPHHAAAYSDAPTRAADAVEAQLQRCAAARAVGEIGLDYFYDHAPRAVQRDVFRAQVALARRLDLPVVIHTREADDDTLAILREAGGDDIRGVLHCFTGTPTLADAALALGLHISFSGILTFPKAGTLRETARRIPRDRLLIETDSPFLSPAPHRGGRNEPARVRAVAATLAEVHGMDPDELARLTADNFRRLFRP